MRNSSPITSITVRTVRCTPISGARTSIKVPCAVATVAPPAVLPTTMAERRTGATSISRRNPNSRSHTMEIALKIAVDTTLIATMPGKTNFLKSNPPVVPTRPAIPYPRTNRNSNGWVRPVRMRVRVRE